MKGRSSSTNKFRTLFISQSSCFQLFSSCIRNYLEVWAASKSDNELGIGKGGSSDRWNCTSNTELVALLLETETDVDGLDEVCTLG